MRNFHNILLVLTGGTIGSTVTQACIDTSADAPLTLLRLFRQHDADARQVAFKIIQPLNLLSENLAPAAWTTLMTAIAAEQPAQYDGVIVTHGTDTLSYSAAALSFYFHALDTPLLLVSSDYPLEDTRANGLENFICAVDFIRQIGQPGVYVPYRNAEQQATEVHRGARLASCLQLSGDFIGVRRQSCFSYRNGRFSPGRTDFARTPAIALQPTFSEHVLMIRPYPGLDYRAINVDHADAVLHDLYHSGTACVSRQWGDHRSLLNFIDRCRQRDLRVYLAPIIASEHAYQSTRALIAQGADMIWNMSIEAAYCKLSLAYGNFSDRDRIIAFIDTDLADEHIV